MNETTNATTESQEEHHMTRAEFREDIAPLLRAIAVLESKVSTLPDKAAIYTAAFAVHALFWGTIGGTVAMLKVFGAF